ncbi:hypothetical protein NKH91_31780, partial [Mesorhizobium sp. M0894]|uniref:hypothetical protein n=1 Tax=unclassified Mesorhizobium TaxID=325217 RepID=UPI003335222B
NLLGSLLQCQYVSLITSSRARWGQLGAYPKVLYRSGAIGGSRPSGTIVLGEFEYGTIRGGLVELPRASGKAARLGSGASRMLHFLCRYAAISDSTRRGGRTLFSVQAQPSTIAKLDTRSDKASWASANKKPIPSTFARD